MLLRHGAARTRPLPIQLRDDPRDWLDRLPPRSEVIERLIRELKWFLGADYAAWQPVRFTQRWRWPLTLGIRSCARQSRQVASELTSKASPGSSDYPGYATDPCPTGYAFVF